jgi:hypothetical protein
MNHFDAGYTNTLASVVNMYFHSYFPKAITTAAAINQPGAPKTFIYTTQAWLIDLFFDCPARLGLTCTGAEPGAPTPDDDPGCVVCPNSTAQQAVRRAIQDGVITWHAFPHNAEPESADASLFEFGVDFVHTLDQKFGVPKKTVLSQRDVPGLTRGVVPILSEKHIVGVSVGANGGLMNAIVPTLFNWTDMATGTSAITLFHRGGYGSSGKSVKGASVRSSDNETCPDMSDAVVHSGFEEALVYAFRGDNAGPHSPSDVSVALACVENLFPNASVFGSSLDSFGLLRLVLPAQKLD